MNRDMFKEKAVHGTVLFPLAAYLWDGEFVYTVNKHWHKEIEIIYFEKGDFAFQREEESFQIHGPAMVFLDPGVLHALSLEEGQKESALVFDCRMLSYELYDPAQHSIIEPLLKHKLIFRPFLYPEDPLWEEVLPLFKRAVSEYQKGTDGARLRVKLALTELLSILYDAGYLSPVEEEEKRIPSPEIEKVIGYLQEHFAEPIGPGDVAEQIGMNEQYFCRYFRKKTGRTLTEYLNELRVQEASKLLSDTDKKIIDIAMECGYNNISYFIKRFKSIRGVTPQEFRKQLTDN